MNECTVWPEPFPDMLTTALKKKAATQFRLHRLPDSREDWQKVRKKITESIWNNLGTAPDHKLKLNPCVFNEIKMDGYAVRNLIFQTRKDFYATASLYVPDGTGPFPAVLNTHGHHSAGRLAENIQARGHVLAKSGYVCLSIDAFGAGERSTRHGDFEYHGDNIGASLLDIGETLLGMQVVDNSRAIDLLSSLDFVDSSAIGVTGASGGGNQAMWIAALDERIKAAVIVVSVGSFQSYVMGSNCICELLPNGLTFTEEYGILALMAPRSVKICNALHDCNPTFYPVEMLRTFKEARKIYQAYNADENFSYQIFNRPHGYWPEIREAALGWFNRALKKQGTGAPVKEPAFTPLPQEKLLCYPLGKRDKNVIGIKAFCRQQAELKQNALREKSAINADEKQYELRRILALDAGRKISKIHRHGSFSTDGIYWERLSLEYANGLLTPLLHHPPTSETNEYAIIAGMSDKKIRAQSETAREQAVAGRGLLVPDVYGLGETEPEELNPQLARHHTLARALLWLGQNLMGEWCADLLTLRQLAETAFNATSVSLYGSGELGIAGIFTEACHPGFSRITAIDSPASFKTEMTTTSFSLGIHLFGILKWGDIPLAAALCDSEISFHSPGKMDGSPLTDQEESAVVVEINRLRSCLSRPDSR